ncbi:Pal1-domain-containing protein [Myriangium duriaei CBS 260.36]|uniref:Pal1-domain-containing protein n=1 Tax=Myriangium duriaei CBS 260.36 TaxID=1168546 RepID=A0A9P4J307_9PEZI|nr:Pal1-domain-containing protein [Myriangium duriaei CBS 260.36]
MDKEKADEDRRRRERRREREARREKDAKDGKDTKDKDSKSRSKPLRRPQGFDVIDKLDLTGIYGSGFIHHDGPFDACNPHRNKKHNQKAPMQAFHPNSANNALGGNSPRQFDHDKFHGRGVEGFADYATVSQDYYTTDPAKRDKHLQDKVAQYINPTDRGQQIHGEESTGLGTSTFLEGAPASRSAQRRRESENDMQPMNNNPGGLGRTKSLAMRIRGLSQPRRPGEGIGGRVNSPDGYGPKSPESPPAHSQSAGGPLRARPMASEKNPFFENGQSNHDDAYEKKGARIEFAEASNNYRSNSSSRAPALTRAVTTDSAPTSSSFEKKDQPSGGFISRMKSLKGGKRPRPEIRG